MKNIEKLLTELKKAEEITNEHLSASYFCVDCMQLIPYKNIDKHKSHTIIEDDYESMEITHWIKCLKYIRKLEK